MNMKLAASTTILALALVGCDTSGDTTRADVEQTWQESSMSEREGMCFAVAIAGEEMMVETWDGGNDFDPRVAYETITDLCVGSQPAPTPTPTLTEVDPNKTLELAVMEIAFNDFEDTDALCDEFDADTLGFVESVMDDVRPEYLTVSDVVKKMDELCDG